MKTLLERTRLDFENSGGSDWKSFWAGYIAALKRFGHK